MPEPRLPGATISYLLRSGERAVAWTTRWGIILEEQRVCPNGHICLPARLTALRDRGYYWCGQCDTRGLFWQEQRTESLAQSDCPRCGHPLNEHFRGHLNCMHGTEDKTWACACDGIEGRLIDQTVSLSAKELHILITWGGAIRQRDAAFSDQEQRLLRRLEVVRNQTMIDRDVD